MTGETAALAEHEEVTCVLVPLQERTLLIPNVCVAEVLPWRRTKALTGVPPWCLGVLGWRGESVVVTDFEAIIEPSAATAAHRALLVMKKTHDWEGSPFYALATAGLPRLLHLSEDEVVRRDGEPRAGISMIAGVGAEEVIIPDLHYIEDQVRQIL